MANPNIGECPCPLCAERAYVRKQGKGAQLLYLACDDCGHITPRLQKGQDWILERAVMYGPDGKLPDPPASEPPPPPPAAFDVKPADEPTAHPPAPPPAAPKRRPFFGTLLDN